MADSDGDIEPIKLHPLHDLFKEHSSDDVEVKYDSSEYLQQQLENVALAAIQTAEEKTRERDAKRINQDDVEAAFEEIFQPYRIINEAVTTMGEYQFELKRTAGRSNVLDFDVDENNNDR